MISAENIFIYSYDNKSLIEEARKKHAVVEGDLVTYVNVYQSFLQARKSSKWCQTNFINYNAMLRAVSTRGLLLQHMKRYTSDIKSCGNDLDILRKCIVSSFFSRTAKLNHDGSYSTVKDDKKMYIHPNSVLSKRAPEWVVYTELVQTSKLFITDVTVIEPRWLIEMAPSYYQMKGMRAAF
ncbi:hypothetical protein BC833DRAFT_578073 [Globomyces pollinis-pini]|nr:hypothetical protein BC833DRAFT_578073 [Globomyces pollinis-pini]